MHISLAPGLQLNHASPYYSYCSFTSYVIKQTSQAWTSIAIRG